MATITYRLPTDKDIMDLAANMRQADIDELQVVCGLPPDQAVIESIKASDPELLRAYLADDQLVCITGCSPVDEHHARPWLLATGLLDGYYYRLQKETLGILNLMRAKYQYLSNVVDARNTMSIEWLKSLGFTVIQAPDVLGDNKVLSFYMGIDNTPVEVKPVIKDFKAAILAAEDIIKAAPQVELEVHHHFSPGVYAREMFIPAGTVLTGKIHKTEHLCIVSAGEIEIADETGVQRVCAPATFVSKPGAKRLGVAMADTVFITVHGTYETDLQTLEDTLVATTYEAYEQHLIAANEALLLEGVA
jgi:hypothetical protein